MAEWKEKAGALKDRAFFWLRLHKKGLVERGKTLLIVLLFLSACFFADQSGILGKGGFSAIQDRLAALLHVSDGNGTTLGGRAYAAAARPQVMTVSPEAGTRHGAAWGSEADDLYDRFAAYLGEALSTAGTPEAVSREQWQEAVAGTGVYFDFVEPQSLVCLAAWQGTSLPESASDAYARRLFLSVEDAGVWLYFTSADNGVVYRCVTTLDKSAVESRMAVYQSNGAYFAFERETAAALDPDCVIVPGSDEVRSVSVSAAAPTGTTESILQLFGMNAITATSYLEAKGTTVYLDGDSTLRMSGDGLIAYERESGLASVNMELRGVTDLPDLVDRLYRMVQELAGEASECGELRLTGASYDLRKDEYIVRFAYFIDGMQVCYTPGTAAEFTVTGGVLTQAQVYLRQYQFTGETQTPLPAVQAAALVTAAGGTDPVRVYQDQGDRVTVSWRMR